MGTRARCRRARGRHAEEARPQAEPFPQADELARLQRENEKLQHELYKANTIIDVQRKLAALLGETLPVPTAEDFDRAEQTYQTKRKR